MALVPVITSCLSNNCQTLSVTDITGVYNVSTNLTGWETPNIAGSAITAATLTITFANGGTQVVNVLSQIPDTVTGSFSFTDITLTGYTDGVTNILYELESSSATYSTQLNVLFTCKVRACVDKMWRDIACKACSNSCEVLSIIDDANLAEGLLRGLENAGACGNIACIEKILDSLTQLCSWNNCNC